MGGSRVLRCIEESAAFGRDSRRIAIVGTGRAEPINPSGGTCTAERDATYVPIGQGMSAGIVELGEDARSGGNEDEGGRRQCGEGPAGEC